MSKFAGPLLPFVVVNTRGVVMPRRPVTLHYANGAEAAVYLDKDRTPAPRPLLTDDDGNVGGYFAEPGFYRVRAGDVPEVETVAVLDEAEVLEVAGSKPGPVGPQGPTGEDAPDRFYGYGPPDAEGVTIVGAKPGDEYLDHNTGDLYVLG